MFLSISDLYNDDYGVDGGDDEDDGAIVQKLPKALRTQALTALTSNFGLVGLVRWVWLGRFG